MTSKAKQTQACRLAFRLSFLHPRYWLVWFGAFLMYLLALCPISFRHFLGRKIGSLLYKKHKKRVSVIKTNINLCFPELSPNEQAQFIEEHLQWYACGLLDYSFYLFASKKRLYKSIEIEGKAHLDQALAEGNNIILLLGHSVFLDFCSVRIGQYYKAYCSYKTESNPVINWLLAYARCRYMDFLIPREAGMMRLVRNLKKDNILIFLADEDLGKKHAEFAPFFGVPKATLTSAARLAQISKAKSLPIMVFFDKNLGKYKVIINKPLADYPSKDNQRNTTIMNQGFETLIRHYPTQYMWLMKWFKTQIDTDENRY